MYTQLLPQLWMIVPKAERDYIAQHFGLNKTGISEIRDQEVISDGYTQDDLSKLTHEKMTEFIGSQETFPRAWELTVAKAHSELNPPAGVISKIEEEIKLDVSKVEETLKKVTKKGK